MRVIVLFKIRFEMLQQGYLFLQFLRKVCEIILRHHILLLIGSYGFSLVVEKLRATGLSDNFGGVIEKHTGRHIREQIAETVF